MLWRYQVRPAQTVITSPSAGLRLRHIVSSGEPLPWRLAKRLQAAAPTARLLNLYGSCETGADATACNISALLAARPQIQNSSSSAGGNSALAAEERAAGSACGGAADLAGATAAAAADAARGGDGDGDAAAPAGRPILTTIVAIVRFGETDSDGETDSCSSGCRAAPPTAAQKVAAGGADDALPPLAAAGEIGEVWVAGPGVAAGYVGSPPAAAAARFATVPAAALLQHLAVCGASGGRSDEAAAAASRDGPASSGSIDHEQPGAAGVAAAAAAGVSAAQPALLWGAGAAAWLAHITQGSTADGSCCVRFFRTGDLGYVDAGSRMLHLAGRCDLQVKVRGVPCHASMSANNELNTTPHLVQGFRKCEGRLCLTASQTMRQECHCPAPAA